MHVQCASGFCTRAQHVLRCMPRVASNKMASRSRRMMEFLEALQKRAKPDLDSSAESSLSTDDRPTTFSETDSTDSESFT